MSSTFELRGAVKARKLVVPEEIGKRRNLKWVHPNEERYLSTIKLRWVHPDIRTMDDNVHWGEDDFRIMEFQIGYTSSMIKEVCSSSVGNPASSIIAEYSENAVIISLSRFQCTYSWKHNSVTLKLIPDATYEDEKMLTDRVWDTFPIMRELHCLGILDMIYKLMRGKYDFHRYLGEDGEYFFFPSCTWDKDDTMSMEELFVKYTHAEILAICVPNAIFWSYNKYQITSIFEEAGCRTWKRDFVKSIATTFRHHEISDLDDKEFFRLKDMLNKQRKLWGQWKRLRMKAKTKKKYIDLGTLVDENGLLSLEKMKPIMDRQRKSAILESIFVTIAKVKKFNVRDLI